MTLIRCIIVLFVLFLNGCGKVEEKPIINWNALWLKINTNETPLEDICTKHATDLWIYREKPTRGYIKLQSACLDVTHSIDNYSQTQILASSVNKLGSRDDCIWLENNIFIFEKIINLFTDRGLFRRAYEFIVKNPCIIDNQTLAELKKHISQSLMLSWPAEFQNNQNSDHESWERFIIDVLGVVPLNRFYNQLDLPSLKEKTRPKKGAKIYPLIQKLLKEPFVKPYSQAKLNTPFRAVRTTPNHKSYPKKSKAKIIKAKDHVSNLINKTTFSHPLGNIVFEYDNSNSKIYFEPSHLNKQGAWEMRVPGAVNIQLVDLFGDSTKELYLWSRRGSGFFLDIHIIDLVRNTTALQIDDMERGTLSIIDLDLDKNKELLLRRSNTKLTDCGQCPATYKLDIYKYSPEANKYVTVTSSSSTSEAMINTTHNLVGAGPHSVINNNKISENIDALASYLETLPLDMWNKSNLLPKFQELEYLLSQANAGKMFDLSSRYLSKVINLLKKNPENTYTRLWRAQFYSIYIFSEFKLGNLEKVKKLLKNNWYLNVLKSMPTATNIYYEFLSVVAQQEGNLADLFENIKLAEKALGKETAATQGNLSFYYRMVGDFKAAYKTSLNAYALSNEENNLRSAAFNSMHLASSAYLNGNAETALDWIVQSLRLSLSLPDAGVSSYTYAIAADLALNKGYPYLAIKILDQSLIMLRPDDWQHFGSNFFLLYAKAFEYLGMHDEKILAYKISIKLANQNQYTPYIQSAYRLSKHYHKNKSQKEALKWARLAFDRIIAGRKSVGVEVHKFSFLQSIETIGYWYFELLFEKHSTIDKVLYDIELWKMQTFLDVYGNKAHLEFVKNNKHTLLELIQNTLSSDDIFLNYLYYGNNGIVATIDRGGKKGLTKLPCKNKKIHELIRSFKQHIDIRNKSSIQHISRNIVSIELKDILNKLSECLINPLEKLLIHYKKIAISTDGILFDVPWDALIFQNQYLVENFEIIQIPSALLLLKPTVEVNFNINKDALIVGVTDSISKNAIENSLGNNTQNYSSLAALHYGDREVNLVSSMLSKHRQITLLGSKQRKLAIENDYHFSIASPRKIRSALEKVEIAHFVTHGLYNKVDPMRSILFVEQGEHNSVLTANDLTKLDLNNLTLLTLGSCQTGNKSVATGSEPIGFLRGALVAGVKSVILADWEIDDKVTFELFGHFYKHLELAPPSSALKNAKLAIMGNYPHPYFWAGISIHGDWVGN